MSSWTCLSWASQTLYPDIVAWRKTDPLGHSAATTMGTREAAAWVAERVAG